MRFNNKDSAFQYMVERKNEIIAGIDRERETYIQQYQRVSSIPEVGALVNEVVRLMQENYYSHVCIGSERVVLKHRLDEPAANGTSVYYRSFNLNAPQYNLIGFIKYLCKEVYDRLNYDLRLRLLASVCGSYEVVVNKFRLNIYDADNGIPPSHCCAVPVYKNVSGKNIITEITDFCRRYCSIDYFDGDASSNRYELIKHDHCDIAEIPEGLFRSACFYELTHIKNVRTDRVGGCGIILSNATPAPNSQPIDGINW